MRPAKDEQQNVEAINRKVNCTTARFTVNKTCLLCFLIMESQQKQQHGYRGSSEASNKTDNWQKNELQRATTKERSTLTIEKKIQLEVRLIIYS